MTNYTTSQRGVDLIKKFESLRLEAYKCPAGVLTIGYGHTGPNDKPKPGQIITASEADRLLLRDIEVFEKGVNSLKLQLNQNQFDALVSFSFNLGVTALRDSRLVKKARVNPNDSTIKAEFSRFVHAGGVKLNGLVIRRAKEASLYFEPCE